MFSFFATVFSVVWISEHIKEVLIGLAVLLLIIILICSRRKKRRAAYLALPVRFVGNRSTKTYHAPGCPKLTQIAPANMVAFRLENETVRMGYRPCGTCNPRW